MRENYFKHYTEYQRTRIKHLLIKLVSIKIESNESSYNENFVIETSNDFLNQVVKPTWFKEEVDTIRDVYEYTEYIYTNWKTIKTKLDLIRVPVLYPKDIITEEQKNELKNLIEKVSDLEFNINTFPAAYKKIYNGMPIADMDINCIQKKSFDIIKSFLIEIQKRGIIKK